MDWDEIGWLGCLDDLRSVADRLIEAAQATGHSAREADVAVKMFGAIMGAYLSHIWAEPEHTAFLPSVGYHQMYGTPNPDTLYRNAAIDGSGEYGITGYRGSVPDVTVMPFGAPTPDGLQTFTPFDLDDLAAEEDGTFEVVLSRHRPPGVRNWWRLDPEMRTLMLRSVSDQWGAHIEPRLAIVRLDIDPRRERAPSTVLRRRFRSFASVVEAMVMSGIKRVGQLQAQGVVNRLIAADYSASGGLGDQWYQEGCFLLGDEEVLVVEADVSPDCRAFSLSLTDPFFSTIDWANAQSSLNRHQAVIDADGVLRVVVATSDPGVRNWLDTTGHRFGVLQCRWLGGAVAPDVSVQVVAAASLDRRLPASIARVSPAERAATIRGRQIGVQMRSRL